MDNDISSSNINEIMRAVLSSVFFFFLRKDFARTSSTKKHPKAQKRNQAKAQNANKQAKIKNAFRKHLSGKK